MKIILENGYPFPYPANLSEDDADAHSAAAAGIRLEISGVVHFEWLHTVTVEFENFDAYEMAKELTGWTEYGYMILEAQTSDADGYGHPAIIAKDKAYCGFILKP